MGIRDFLIGWDDANAFGGDEFLYKNGYLPEGQAKSAIYSFKNGLQISVIFNEEDSAMKNKDYIYIAYAKAWAHSMTR